MLRKLTIENFTCFPKAELSFSKGLNVIVGENGTGKSHILKLGYVALRALSWPDASFAKDAFARSFARHLTDVFRGDTLGRLASRVQGHSSCQLDVQLTEKAEFKCKFSTQSSDRVTIESLHPLQDLQPPLFIPPKEILSVFPGFQQALEGRELHFDATYLDLAKLLAAAPLKGPRLEEIASYLDPLEKILEGQVVLDKGAFYFNAFSESSPTKHLEAQLMPEGYRKIGMLMHLLRTGGLREKSSLFWDEPEANLNPKLVKKLAEILVGLSKVMQITIATHSLFLLRELEIFAESKQLSKIRYFGLHFAGHNVQVQQGKSPHEIGDISSLDAELEQSRRYLDAGE